MIYGANLLYLKRILYPYRGVEPIIHPAADILGK